MRLLRDYWELHGDSEARNDLRVALLALTSLTGSMAGIKRNKCTLLVFLTSLIVFLVDLICDYCFHSTDF